MAEVALIVIAFQRMLDVPGDGAYTQFYKWI
jgi:hypothetical protein